MAHGPLKPEVAARVKAYAAPGKALGADREHLDLSTMNEDHDAEVPEDLKRRLVDDEYAKIYAAAVVERWRSDLDDPHMMIE